MICEVSGAKERLNLLTVIPVLVTTCDIGKEPIRICRGLGAMLGKTSPGQSHRRTFLKISSKHHFLGIGQPGKEDGLEVLGMSGRFWNAHLWENIHSHFVCWETYIWEDFLHPVFCDLFLPQQWVDQAWLAHIGMAKGSNSEHFLLIILSFRCECPNALAHVSVMSCMSCAQRILMHFNSTQDWVNTSGRISTSLPSILALQSVKLSSVTSWQTSSTWYFNT